MATPLSSLVSPKIFTIAKKIHSLESMKFSFGTDECLFPVEIHALAAIDEGFCTVTALSKKTGRTKGAVSQTISKLYAKNFLSKKRNAVNSKEVFLSLTAKGQKICQAHANMHARMDAKLEHLFDNYSKEQICLIMDFLDQIGVQIENYLNFGLSEQSKLK